MPPGVYQTFLSVLQPGVDGSLDELRASLAFRRELVQDFGGPANLVPWAVIGRDLTICWRTDGPDPSAWRVAVLEEPDVHEFHGGCVEFLLAFVPEPPTSTP